MGTVVDSAWECLIINKGSSDSNPGIQGWNSNVKLFQDEAKFWNSIWNSAGRPRQGNTPGIEHPLNTNMKYSRNQYHFAVGRTQHSLQSIENYKLICGINFPNLFEKIKKSCRETNSNITSVVDDVHDAVQITNHFKLIYEALYNEQEGLRNTFSNLLEAGKTTSLFTGELVKSAVSKLKPDKSDVSGMFTSDCLRVAPDIFFEKLAHLFRLYLLHGHVSYDLLVCALCPIVKDPNRDIAS